MPSERLSTGKLFVDMAAGIAGDYEFAGMPTGLTAMASDYHYIDPALVLAERAGVPVEPRDESQRDLFDAKEAMSRNMP
jgi:hypothetical protein